MADAYDFATKFTTNPLDRVNQFRGVRFNGQELGTQAVPEEQAIEIVGARPIKPATETEDPNEDHDPNFVKNALAYGGQGRSSVTMPVVSYFNDDSDFRGGSTYMVA